MATMTAPPPAASASSSKQAYYTTRHIPLNDYNSSPNSQSHSTEPFPAYDYQNDHINTPRQQSTPLAHYSFLHPLPTSRLPTPISYESATTVFDCHALTLRLLVLGNIIVSCTVFFVLLTVYAHTPRAERPSGHAFWVCLWFLTIPAMMLIFPAWEGWMNPYFGVRNVERGMGLSWREEWELMMTGREKNAWSWWGWRRPERVERGWWWRFYGESQGGGRMRRGRLAHVTKLWRN